MAEVPNTCALCMRRHDPDFTVVTDAEWELWKAAAPTDTETLCPCCFGLLQFGQPIVSLLESELLSANYQDIFACPLSVQLPAVIVFQNYIEKLVMRTGNPDARFVEVREVLRGLIHRSVVRERINDRMPKLFLDVKFEMPGIEIPEEAFRAVNNRVRSDGKVTNGFKRFKTRQSVNIADIQQMMEWTKGDLSTVYSALFPPALAAPTDCIPISEQREKVLSTFMVSPGVLPTINVGLKRETIYLVGKYVKDTREFGQSVWDANATSVAESICPIVCDLFGSPVDKSLFSASGREDMDVRMLGSGRSFVLQLGDAKNLSPLLDSGALAKVRIDTGDVRVEGGLAYADKGVMDWLHWSTEQHTKVYHSVVWTQAVLPTQAQLDEVHANKTNIKILQKTPLRVLHRRTEHTREKYMHSLQIERLNDHFAIVTLRASAGAYIKEFVHGDFGRTVPCFADVVFGRPVRCDIIQLDVMEVEQDAEEDYVPVWDRG